MKHNIIPRLNSLTGLKIGLAAGVLIAVVILIYLLLPGSTSKEAFINARVSRVLAPTPGILTLSENMVPGYKVILNQPIGKVKATAANTQINQLMDQRNTLMIQIADFENQISGINNRLDTYHRQLSVYHAESKTQRDLEDKQTRANHLQIQKKLEAAKAQANFAAAQLKSVGELYKKHSISRIEYEHRLSEAKTLQASEESIAAQLKESLLDIEASSIGLQLSGPRTLDAPNQYQRNLSLTIEEMVEQKAKFTAQKQAADISLENIDEQLARQQVARINSTLNGVIWSIDTETGSTVREGSPILKVMDCNERWVEAFFSESDAGMLHPGMQVQVTLDSDSGTRWRGIVKTIRAGTGRVTVGESVVMPPPEIARRQLPVKVVTAHINIQWKEPPKASDFCLAGRSVTVHF